MSSQNNQSEMYAPLVEYTQNKEFAGLMETLFGVVEKLQEREKINEGEYLDLANLTKKLYEAKTKIEKSVVYVEIIRRAKKEPPKPPKSVDKLTDPNYRTCEFCNGRFHCKFLREHQRTTRSCIKQQQARRNIITEKYTKKDDRHTWRQAFAVQLIARYKTGMINNNKIIEETKTYINNDRIMGVITPPPYQKMNERTGEEHTVYPKKENHTEANIRMWNEVRPDVAPTYEPYPLCSDEVEGFVPNPNKKIGGAVMKSNEEISKEMKTVYKKKTNEELYMICMSRGIKVLKSYKKDMFIDALIVNALSKKTTEVDKIYEEIAVNDLCYTYDKAPKKKENKKAPLIIEEDDI